MSAGISFHQAGWDKREAKVFAKATDFSRSTTPFSLIEFTAGEGPDSAQLSIFCPPGQFAKIERAAAAFNAAMADEPERPFTEFSPRADDDAMHRALCESDGDHKAHVEYERSK